MRLTVCVIWAAALWCVLSGQAAAIDPARSIGQYKHTRWTIDDGAPSSVGAMAQGPSGFLWIGSQAGLFRFDGVSFAEIRYRDGRPATGIVTLMVSREGHIWAGFGSGGTAVFRNGVLHDVPMGNNEFVLDLVQTPDRSIWATLGRSKHQFMRYSGGRWIDVSARFGFPAEDVVKMIAARDGTIWVSTLTSVIYLRPGAGRFERTDILVEGHAAVAEDKDNNIWLSDEAGSRVIAAGGKLVQPAGRTNYPSPTAKRRVLTLFDRDGNLWGKTERGLFRVRTPRTGGAASPAEAVTAVTNFRQGDGLLADDLTALMEDREGNIWVGSPVGIERFRPARVVAEPTLVNRAFWGDPLLAASDGSVYVGEANGVYRIRPGGSPELFMRADEPQALCEGGDGAVWIILGDRAVRHSKGRFDNFGTPAGLAKKITDCAVDRSGHIWLASPPRGLLGFVNGTWRPVMTDAAVRDFPPRILLTRPDRSLLVSFESTSLAAFEPSRGVQRLVQPNKGFGMVTTLYQTRNGLLVGGQSGLGLIRGGTFRALSSDRFPQLGSVGGIVQTKLGQTWMSSTRGIVAVPTVSLLRAFADPNAVLKPVVFDFRDGLMGVQSRDALRATVLGGDGRIWFGTSAGIVWIDPARLPANNVPPPTAISALKANGVTYRDPTGVELAAGTSRVQLDYSALSLTIPERVRVLYKLEGADRDWVDPGMRRQAFYTNLGPGHYVFRVIAANDDGVWNRVGSTLAFDIPPTFLQSGWFLAICGLSFCALLWFAYRFRIGQLRTNMRVNLEERLAERERIARDLHDTLLQGFQGLILRFQSIANERSTGGRTRQLIEHALDSADQVINEGRDSVHQLRKAHETELSQALTSVAEGLRRDYPGEFELVVEGQTRTLHPLAREELCRIGEQALINAFQHGQGTRVDLGITYAAASVTLGVRDNGVGIPADIVASGGRQGHFGLTGMRERARQIDGSLTIASRPGAGTEISVVVPARVAYIDNVGSGWRKAFRKLLTSDG